jgi:hypothetical protein
MYKDYLLEKALIMLEIKIRIVPIILYNHTINEVVNIEKIHHKML